MDVPTPRAFRPAAPRGIAAHVAAAGLAAMLLAGCTDTRTITAPEAPGLPPAQTPGPAGFSTHVVTCKLGVRQISGAYHTRNVSVRVPDGLLDPQGRTTTFGLRQWAEGQSDPARMVLCDIPATAAAADWFHTLFSPDGSRARPGGVERGRDPTAAARHAFATAPVAVYDRLDAVAEPCYPALEQADDPMAASVASCDDGGIGDGEWEGPQPIDDEPGEDWMGGGGDPVAAPADGGGYYLVVSSCYGQTDRPHRSHHVWGMVNVVARTVCSFPTSMTVSTSLQRQSCWFIFCWWSNRASGFNSRVGTSVQTNAAAPCQTGWWRGSSTHTAVFPTGSTGYAWTGNGAHISWC